MRSADLRAPDTPSGGELRLRSSILDALGEAVVATDVDGRVVYWNDAARRLFGWRTDEAVGSTLEDLLAAEGTEADVRAILRALVRGGRWAGEFFVRDRGGRAFPVLVTTTAVRDGDHRIMGMVAVARDMSAQWDAKRALQDTEERLELVHRAAESVIWEWDLRTGEGRYSEALASAFGYDRAESDGTVEWWAARIHPDDRARVVDGYEEAVREGRRFWTDEYRFRKADGTYAAVFDRAYLSVDEDGRTIRVVGNMLDLTDRRRAHETQRFLSQAGMLLELSMDHESTLPSIARLAATTIADYCVITVVDEDGAVELVAAAGADAAIDAWAQDTADRIRSGLRQDTPLERVLRKGESVLQPLIPSAEATPIGGGEAFAAHGRTRPRSQVGSPLTARGATLGVVAFGTVGRELRFGEEELRVAEELGRRVGVAVDNARLFRSAQLAQRAKSDFLSIVSHELRTPLTAVLGYADLLAQGVSGPLNETQKNQVERIRAGSDRLLRLIESILAFARLETGRERVHFRRVQVGALLDHVEEIIRPRAAEKGIGFEIECPARDWSLLADPDKVSQVLLSLLLNAIKFTERGSVGLRCARENGTLCFDVSDTGPGIAPEHSTRVFNPFWQAEQPEVRRAGGAGLGLSVARQLARLMSGDVAVLEGAPGRTTLRFTLPTESA